MAFTDYYNVLNISKNASEKDVKQAYRKLARKFHPDLNPNDKEAEKKFKEINEANEVLSNAEHRKKYDTYGEQWQHAEEFEKAKQQEKYAKSTGNSGRYAEEDFSDFFENMFAGARQQKTTFRGQDFNAALQLDLKEVFTTHKRTLTINNKNIRITIPAGLENGQVIKIPGYGGKGTNGGPNGDVYIQFSIINTTNFKRDGDHLHTTVNLDLYTALLGGSMMVQTLEGAVKLTVKPETQNGTKVKLKGKGFPKYKKEGQFGDLYITYLLKIPTKLTPKEKELFTELSKLR